MNGKSGALEPKWKDQRGEITRDNDIIWVCIGKASSIGDFMIWKFLGAAVLVFVAAYLLVWALIAAGVIN